MSTQQHQKIPSTSHKVWVRVSHWVVTISFFALVYSGFEILKVHPRLYWGEVGNDLTPALLELPISRNYKHGGWEKSAPFFDTANSPISASRTYDIFNDNGWGRSFHFLFGWLLVIAGFVYLLRGFFSRHFRRHLWPRSGEFTRINIWREMVGHFRLQIPPATGGPQYGLLQKCTYLGVVFFLLPVMVLTGFTMSPAITAGYPFLLKMFFGAQSARTIHFFASVLLLLFLLVHLLMIVRSGLVKQISSMTVGK